MYNEKFDADQQITLEEMIAFALSNSATDHLTDEEIDAGDSFDPYPEEVCQRLSRDILYNVVRVIRPDLMSTTNVK